MCGLCDNFGMIDDPARPGREKKCPECDTPPYRPYSLQRFAADVEAEEPGYGDWIHAQNEHRLAHEREENANCAVRGVMQGLADYL